MKFVGLAIALAYLLWYMSRSTIDRELPDKIKMPEGLGGSSPLPPAGAGAPGLPPVRYAPTPPRETIEINIRPMTQADLAPPPQPINWTLIAVGLGGLLLVGGWFAYEWRGSALAEQDRRETIAKDAADREAGVRILAARLLREKGFGDLQPGPQCSTGMLAAKLQDGSFVNGFSVYVTGFVVKEGQRSAVQMTFLDAREPLLADGVLPAPESLHLFRIEIDEEVRWWPQSESQTPSTEEMPEPAETP